MKYLKSLNLNFVKLKTRENFQNINLKQFFEGIKVSIITEFL